MINKMNLLVNEVNYSIKFSLLNYDINIFSLNSVHIIQSQFDYEIEKI